MAFHYRPKQSQTWRIYWYDDITGKLKSESAKTREESVAKKKAKDKTAKLRLQIQDNRLMTPGDHRLKLNEAFQLFISQNEFKPKTIRAHSTALDHLLGAAGDKYLYQYSNFDMFKLKDRLNKPRILKTKDGREIEKPRAKNSKANYTRHLSIFFNWMIEKKLIKENIIEMIETESKDVSVIPQDDLDTIFSDIKKINPKHYELLRLKYLGAYRVEEVLAVTPEDFDLKNNILRIRNFKGGRDDMIPMVKDLRDHIVSMKLHKSGRLTTITYAGLRSFWERCMKRVKLDYTLHQLRKTRGTELANSGVKPLFLQQFMRHKNFGTTQQYYIKIDIKQAEKNINSVIKCEDTKSVFRPKPRRRKSRN